ncbi:hypothetical protein QVD17_08945 [Tagetes erecta]|uniref:Uncharacterized protein n=1 Tax=Tagetes erecta TaxID=13708 RepID=A0AAD8L3C1_TARER|nr:hypothetical protein QVD17_08945 [Tagetes erecta]
MAESDRANKGRTLSLIHVEGYNFVSVSLQYQSLERRFVDSFLDLSCGLFNRFKVGFRFKISKNIRTKLQVRKKNDLRSTRNYVK